ncbi:MAG: hypothetical protein J0J04_07715 [Microbacterium sp.]|uniref:hypothetical protein n=1 Tax=Microbacterium sp. TaxID=51671 RepID=UPI001AD33D9F|nr:hypothetical protein [Microbacterium sp.]MBN9214685.1 hypothetical protein [Microbacterium sp.]
MAREKKNRGASAPQARSVWTDQTVADNPDAPAQRRELNGLKWKRRALTVVAFGAVPAMFLMGAGMVAQANTPEVVDNSAASTIVNSSAGKSEAFRALNAWLNTDPSPLPGGTVVSWDGFTSEEPPAPTSDTEIVKDYRFETHSFTVARGSSMWHASIQVVVDDVIGATATSAPSLEPIADVQVSASDPWFTLQSTAASAQVKQAVDAWAIAFTGGDSDALHQIVQDRDTNRSYIPLYDVQQFVGAEITAAGAKPLETGAGASTDTIVVRVLLSFWWKNGKPAVAENEKEPIPTPIAYDVLVEHADTATPVVVAWGAPGSGPKLTAYSNAVDTILSAPTKGLEEEDATPAPDQTGDTVEGEDQ